MSDINFNCPHCEHKIEAPAEMIGMKAECPSCQCELEIPNQTKKELPAKLTPIVEPRPQFVAAKCPSCKGDLQVPNNREEVKCMYCGGTVIVNQAIQLVSGVNVANLIELAKAAAKALNYKEAYDYYTKVLEYEPMNFQVWAGKGEAAGWQSSLSNIRTLEMISDFDNAIKYAPESEKQAMQIYLANLINHLTSTLYGMAKKHLKQFIKLNNAWPDYLQQCRLLIAALEFGNLYDPENKTTIENIIYISTDNLQGAKFTMGLGMLQKKLSVTPQYEAQLKTKINEYTAKMYRLNPNFVKQ